MRLLLVVTIIGCSGSSTPDASGDASTDGFVLDASDAGSDARFDAGFDAGDAGFDASIDVGTDTFDAGPADLDGDGVTADEDCDDDDPTVWTLRPGFVDMDSDAYGAGDEVDVCSGDALSTGYAEVGGDCDDGDTDNWTSCAACVDEDDDEWFVGCDRYIERAGPDCAPTDDELFRAVEVFADPDGDGRGTGVGETRCLAFLGPDLGEAIGGGDCDETNELRRPGIPELPDDGTDNDCDGVDRSALGDDGIYVARAHPDCQELTPGTRTTPNCTIGAALGFSVEGDAIYIAEGTYTESIDTISRSFFGGYRSSDWTRGATTVVDSPTSPSIQLRGVAALTHVNVVGGLVLEFATFVCVDCDLDTATSWESHVTLAASRVSTGVSFAFGSALVLDSQLVGDGVALHANHVSPVYVRDSILDGGTASSPVGCEVTNLTRALLERAVCLGGTGSASARGAVTAGDAVLVAVSSHFHGGAGTYTTGFHDQWSGTLVNCTVDAGDGTMTRRALHTSDFRSTTAINSIFVVRGTADHATAIDTAASTAGTARLIRNVLYAPLGDLARDRFGVPLTLADVNACTWPGCTEASGNISVDPMLAADGIHLMSSSPAIDQGVDPSTVGGFAVTTDYDGDARPAGTGWDIGADEAP